MPDTFDYKQINIATAIEVMESIISSYEDGKLSKKTASKSAKKLLRAIKKFTPKEEQKELYELVLDLSISLTTIDRAEKSFESFYLDSLKDELNKAKTM